MKTKNLTKVILVAALFLVFSLEPLAFAQGTAFTYQGRLNVAGSPASGSYDLQFSLFATNVSGIAIAGPVTNVAVGMTDGLFTTIVDFGPGVFTGTSNWLEIAVSTNGANTFSTLTPRQQLSPVPYAITAENANSLSGLTLLQNSSGAPNVIGGAADNSVSSSVVGGTIAGGGATNFPVTVRGITTYFSYTNKVTGDFGTVSGGAQNTAGSRATVGGGEGNTASGQFTTVGGGDNNTASGQDSTVGGGANNTAGGNYSTVPGGQGDRASGLWSFAAGVNAQATNTGSFVWSDSSLFYSKTDYEFAVRARGGVRFAGDVQLDNSTYHYLSLNGGNALGYLYGSYPAWGDGVHLGYNYYADASGADHIINAGGGTSRLTTGYGFIDLAVNSTNGPPTNVMLHATSSGVGIGTTSPFYPLDVQGNVWMENYVYVGTYGSPWNGYLQVNGLGQMNNGLNVYGYGGNHVYFQCELDVNGNAYKPGGGSWGSFSDERLKKNIRPLTGVLDKLLELQGVSYEYIDPEKIHELSGERIGMIAQEVEKVFPDWVSTGKDGYKRLTYRGFEALTVEALRELKQQQEAQLAEELKRRDAEHAELKRQNQLLEERLAALEQIVLSQKPKSEQQSP